jgi:signal transduction histidine kinase
LTTRRPEHPISWVIALSAAGTAILCFAYAYAVEALVAGSGSLPGGTAAAWIDNWGWVPSLALLPCALLLLMPDGRLGDRRWWPVPAALVLGTLLASFAVSSSPTFDLGSGPAIDNPLGRPAVEAAVAGIAGGALLLAALAGALAAFVSRYRRSRGDERQQLRWVGLSLAVSVLLGLVGAGLWGVVPGAELLPALASLALPAGIAVAILKYRLYEIDLIVNRALVYSALTACVVGSYVAVVGLVGAKIAPHDDLLVSLVVTGVVAVSFQPARERVQRFVNRLMYGERDDPYAAVARLGRRLESTLRPEALLPTVVSTIGQTLALDYVALAVESGPEHGRVTAEYGTPTPATTTFPLVYQGGSVGEMRLAPRPGERLRERDRRLITDLAPHVAAVVHAVGLAEDLRAARGRVVGLREEERRRIRRDLHDGLGPALAGLTFKLEAVRNLTGSDLRRANELLVSATEQVQTMVADVRLLIYGLRPPTLDELGLAESLRALASRAALPETEVRIDAPSALPPLPAAVEVAAYWITQEALTNVKRHANARSCDVRLTVEPAALRLEISDDGDGFSARAGGIGLQTMKERAAEIGGACQISPAARGGTVVTARLPRQPAEAPAR